MTKELSRNSADLAAILERLASKGTPGPWRIGSPTFACTMDHAPHGRGLCEYTLQGWMDDAYWRKYIYRDKPMKVSGDEECVAGTWDYEEGGIRKEADAELICEMLNNLPAIIAALRFATSEMVKHPDLEILREVAISPVSHDAGGYVEVQINRAVWNAMALYRHEGETHGS